MTELSKTDIDAAARRYTEVNDGALLLLCSDDREARFRTVRVYALDVNGADVPDTHGEYCGSLTTSNYLGAWIKMLTDPADQRQQATGLFEREAEVVSWLRMMQKA